MTPTNNIADAQSFAASIRNKNAAPTLFKVDPFFEEDPYAAKVLEFAITNNRNVLIVGPTGAGKSSLAVNVIARLKREGKIFSCDGETSTDYLIGKPWIVMDPKGNKLMKIAYGAALEAYKDGKILILEEVDHAMPDVLSSMHRIMEEQSDFFECHIGEGEVIKRHPQFCVIGTANTIGTGEDSFLYAGAKVMNLATKKRFHYTIKMGYIARDKEIRVLINKTGIDSDMAKLMVDVANDSRDATDPQRLGHTTASHQILQCLSTRDLIAWGTAVMGMSMSPLEAAEPTFLNSMNETDADVVRDFVRNRF